jgi:hypothetical protein
MALVGRRDVVDASLRVASSRWGRPSRNANDAGAGVGRVDRLLANERPRAARRPVEGVGMKALSKDQRETLLAFALCDPTEALDYRFDAIFNCVHAFVGIGEWLINMDEDQESWFQLFVLAATGGLPT